MNTFDQMIERGHERVCFHHDEETGLRAIIAVHSTVLGNALGGCRRWHYATESDALYDVLRLSEGMTYKAACANLPMGGAKSVILMPKANTPRTEAEARAMGRFVDTFAGKYIAAEDVGINEQFVNWMSLETKHVTGGDTTGGDPSPFTAQGVVNGMKACIAHAGIDSFKGLTVAIQGVGNVGRNVARILHDLGARLYVADINEAAVKSAVDQYGATPMTDEEILTSECDILAPCALGAVIDCNLVQRLRCRIVCGGANNELDDPDEDAVALQNAGIHYAPDFVVNAGGLIHLAGLYLGMTAEQLTAKINEVETTTARILEESATTSSTHAAAVAIARRRIAEGSNQSEQVYAG
jgi:leucine dehydrogenase